jgi:predicted phosphodiesterase
MKIAAIGDIHGRDVWKHLNVDDFDKVIFIGDYFDSFTIDGRTQIINFKNILKLKTTYPDKVVLLLGNHDFHYLPSINEHYSGYQAYLNFDIGELLKDNISLFNIIHIEEQFLFSHAGVSSLWLKEIGLTLEEINAYFSHNPKAFGFSASHYRNNYGDEICQGPLWIRPNSLRKSFLPGYVHVVGHTHQPNVTIEKDIILIDTLDHSKQYLVIDNNVPYAKNLN